MDRVIRNHKIYDIEIKIDNKGTLIAKDSYNNQWEDKQFYDFLFNEVFNYNDNGTVDLIDDEDFEKLTEYRKKYSNEVVANNVIPKTTRKNNNIEYFGIDDNTDEEIGKQLEVLYYTTKDEFAIIINTKTDDEVILCKSPKGKTFNEIYNNMKEKKEKYSGSKYFNDLDELKIPKLNLDVKKEYDELKDRLIQTNDSRKVYISDAIQTIKLKIDENGGKLKSEAIILAADSAMSDEKEEKRYFYLDDTFAIFIREKGKKLPYFAARIDDITKFQ